MRTAICKCFWCLLVYYFAPGCWFELHVSDSLGVSGNSFIDHPESCLVELALAKHRSSPSSAWMMAAAFSSSAVWGIAPESPSLPATDVCIHARVATVTIMYTWQAPSQRSSCGEGAAAGRSRCSQQTPETRAHSQRPETNTPRSRVRTWKERSRRSAIVTFRTIAGGGDSLSADGRVELFS